MNVSTINLSTFIVSDGTSTTIPGDIQYYGTTVVFTPSTPLLSSTAYTVTIKNSVVDLSGNTMSSDYFWSFTTEPQTPDSTPPQILSTYPTLNQTNVPVYRNVVVLFNETMLVSSITPTTFSLADSQGTLVPGNITIKRRHGRLYACTALSVQHDLHCDDDYSGHRYCRESTRE